MKALLLFSVFLPTLAFASTDPSVVLTGQKFVSASAGLFNEVAIDGSLKGWQDPSGLVWSQSLGRATRLSVMSRFDASTNRLESTVVAQECAQMGGRLPSETDFKKLFAFLGGIEKGQVSFKYKSEVEDNLLRIFSLSNMIGSRSTHSYWTSLVSSVKPDGTPVGGVEIFTGGLLGLFLGTQSITADVIPVDVSNATTHMIDGVQQPTLQASVDVVCVIDRR